MPAGCTLSKRSLKSWSAVGYCALPGRTSVPCRLLPSAVQSAAPGVGRGVGDGCLVGIAVGLLALAGVVVSWQAASTPGRVPTAQRARNSRRFSSFQSEGFSTASSDILRSISLTLLFRMLCEYRYLNTPDPIALGL